MITVSSAFKTAAKQPIKEWKATLIDNPDDDNPTTYTSGTIQSVTLTQTGTLFNSQATQITIKLLGNLTFHEKVSFSYAIKSGNNWETANRGTYTLESTTLSADKSVTTIVLINKILLIQKSEYNSGFITYPTTVSGMATDIATHFGLTLASMTSLPNYNQPITEDLYANINSTTFRDVLEEIAGATASMAVVDETTQELAFKPLQTASEALSDSEMSKLSLGENYGPVNSLVLARTPQEDNIVVQDATSIETYGLTEVKLANNEIMDDDRQSYATPIFNAIDGMSYVEVELTTIGLGWLECGDKLSITTNNQTYTAYITSLTMTLDGGLKEVIKCEIPDESTTNYALAGGITKTIYNTEIKVDKQANQITSIVSQQTSLQNQVNENYTQITQNLTQIVSSVQNSGGNNIIKNSAMYSKDSNGNPTYWTLSSGSLTITPSAEATANGCLSGQTITLNSATVYQAVTVKANLGATGDDITYYSFGCRVNNTITQTGSIVLSDGVSSRTITIDTANDYKEYYLDALNPKSNTITITVSGDITIADMVLTVGDLHTQWQQASGELSNTQVAIDIDGVKVTSSNLSGTYTTQTPQGFSAYQNNALVSNLTNEQVQSPKVITNNFEQPPLRIISQTDGWAIVEAI